jgi:protease-4
MGDVAASGGYLISLPGEKVFATPLSITGSIGVFLGKFNLGNLYKKIDLKKETLTHSPFANLFGEEKPWNAEEREILIKRLNAYYDNFLKRVSLDRKISSDKAEAAAQGHVWLGQEALGLKLIDQLGGYFESTNALVDKLKLDPNEPWFIVEEPKSLSEMIAGDNPFMEAPSLKEILPSSFSEELRTWIWMEKNPYLYLSPISRIE